MRSLRSQARETVRGEDYSHWAGYVKERFPLHGVNGAEEAVLLKKLRRGQVLAFFAGLSPLKVGMEACGAAHHWARELRALGHEVVLLPPQYVKPYVKRSKSDAADAAAICEAMSQIG